MFKNNILMILLLSLFISNSFAGNNMLKVLKLYKKAKYYENIDIEKTKNLYKSIIPLVKKMVTKNKQNPTSYYILGKSYFYGYGIEKDLKSALYYYNESYKLGNKSSLCGIIKTKYLLGVPKPELKNLYEKLQNLKRIYKKCKKNKVFLKLEKDIYKVDKG